MARDYFSREYQTWLDRIDLRLEKGWSWEQIYLWGKQSEEDLVKFLSAQDEIDHIFTLDEWREFISIKKEHEENSKPIEDVILSVKPGEDDLDAPSRPTSSWIRYKKYLDGKIPGVSIEQLEKSSIKVLNMLYNGSGDEYKTIHGLVMGNVQSGKTANMEGLMSMAADWEWNVFIVLSGTIENLRQQTRNRFMRDLKNGDLTWDSIDNPSINDYSTDYLDLTSRKRYVIVCLKNSVRLAKLLNWLNHDKNKKRQMKVVLIDDESDQASINTANIAEKKEATKINKLIKAIVNGHSFKNNDKNNIDESVVYPYKAMNYIAYTATPYGNFLNENGDDSLYPADFIHVLPTSDIYFGPTQIFGDVVNGTTDGMPIINEITANNGVLDNEEETDVSIIQKMCDEWNTSQNVITEIPKSMQKAIAWFYICIAIQRYHKYTKPVSMLVHHSMKTEYHTSTAVGIKHWLANISIDSFLELVREVYDEQTKKMSLHDFKIACPNYGKMSGIKIDEDVNDYPPLDRLYQYIIEIKSEGVRHITMNQNEEFVFEKGIHLCVDNCEYNTIISSDDEDKIPHVRLVYPTDNDKLDFAPAFLVIGGQTLSRGLTIEGLVCTYFSRDVSQADTLMQMGRWFGYRRGYELLPRIWMTEMNEKKFEQLAALDEQLRTDIIERYLDKNLSPKDYGPVVYTCPLAVKLKITANMKMQGAEAVEADFAGAHIQTTNFDNIEEVLQTNIDVADSFIDSLGEDNHILNDGHESEYRVWENISFETIKNDFFMKSKYELTSMDSFESFCQWFEKKNFDFDNWTVILNGKKRTDNQWHGVGKVTRTRLTSGLRRNDASKINIGVLSDPNVWVCDLTNDYLDNLSDDERKLLVSTGRDYYAQKRELKKRIRQQQGKQNVPRLVIYCIDKNSTPSNAVNRAPLNTKVDVIGVELIIPGQRRANPSAMTIK
ncbi:Z1 domain-containing protein [Selenomonas ruminantium]|uniref:Z1 domain-containing protein n=1 Tax=Selenomonas ruminantium TaxID=971 RepID=A0A1H3YWS7_SELRU|nr:Z1 domain-containing protein [Selenomonas ruminantium]SEA15502.1 Z1 domain-containing protein [Selenomonas ruminantium]